MLTMGLALRVLLDGICAPDLIRISWSSPLANTGAAALMSECGSSAECRAKVGSSAGGRYPLYRLQLLFQLIHAGRLKCSSRLEKEPTQAALQPPYIPESN